MKKTRQQGFKDLASLAKKINLKTKTEKHDSNTNNDEGGELEKGYAVARSAVFEYEFQE